MSTNKIKTNWADKKKSTSAGLTKTVLAMDQRNSDGKGCRFSGPGPSSSGYHVCLQTVLITVVRSNHGCKVSPDSEGRCVQGSLLC